MGLIALRMGILSIITGHFGLMMRMAMMMEMFIMMTYQKVASTNIQLRLTPLVYVFVLLLAGHTPAPGPY